MMNKNEIDPQLKSLLDKLCDVPARDPRLATRGRAQFLSQAVAIREEAVSHSPVVRLREWLNKYKLQKEFKMTTLVSIITALGLLFGGSAGAVYAAQDSLPNDALYGIKLVSENVQLQLADNAQEEFALRLEYAQRRGDEVAALLEEGILPPEDIMLQMQEEVQAALQLTSEMSNAAMTQAMNEVQSRLQIQIAQIGALVLPEDAPAEVEQYREQAHQQYQEALQLAQGAVSTTQAQSGTGDVLAIEAAATADALSQNATATADVLAQNAIETAEALANGAASTPEGVVPTTSGVPNGNGEVVPPASPALPVPPTPAIPPMPGFGN